MPKIILHGYSHRAGSFTQPDTGELIEYDNIVLDVTSDVPLQSNGIKEQHGCHVNEIKVKANLLGSVFSPSLKTVKDLDSWCGKEILCTYVPQGIRSVIAEIRLVEGNNK